MTHKKIKVTFAGNPNFDKEAVFNANHRCAVLENHSSNFSFFSDVPGYLETHRTHNTREKFEIC